MDIVPIFICVVLPVSVVLITSLTKINADNKRTQILTKAIEADREIDTDRLIDAFKKPQKTPREIFNQRLLRGCIFTLIGIVLGIIGLISFSFGNTPFENDAVTVPLVLGGISLAIGLAYLIVCFVNRREIKTNSPE